MKFNSQTKELKQAFRYLWNMYTKSEQDKGVSIVMEAKHNILTLMGFNKEASFSVEVKQTTVLEDGTMLVSAGFIQDLLDADLAQQKIEEWTVSGSDEKIVALSGDGNGTIESEAQEVEMQAEDWQVIATCQTEDFTALMGEVLSSPLKSAREFTDTVLLRLRKDRLNGRNITMQTVVTSSIQVMTDQTDMIDVYVTKKQAQLFNKALKNMPKAKTLSLRLWDGKVSIEANGAVCALRHETTAVAIPDITQLMQTCLTLPASSRSTLNVDAWKKALVNEQKTVDKDERDTLTIGVAKDGTFTSNEADRVAVIRVKETLKLLKSLQKDDAEVAFIAKGMVLRYETPTRVHCSVLTVGKG